MNFSRGISLLCKVAKGTFMNLDDMTFYSLMNSGRKFLWN